MRTDVPSVFIYYCLFIDFKGYYYFYGPKWQLKSQVACVCFVKQKNKKKGKVFGLKWKDLMHFRVSEETTNNSAIDGQLDALVFVHDVGVFALFKVFGLRY